MINRLRKILLFVFFLAFTTLHAAAPQYENQTIEKLEIIMDGPANQASGEFSISGVKSRITTREGAFFSQTEFDNDLKILARDYDQVEPRLQSINGKMHIVLKVRAKPQIRSIVWIGNTNIDTADLRKELGIKPLSTFDRLAFNKAFHKIKAYYVKNGFFEAQLSYDVQFDCDTNEVDIVVYVEEGRAGHIKKLIFCGFTSDEESDLTEMIATKEYNLFFSWYTGEGTYHEEAIQQDQFIILNYLQNKGYADARVELEITEACRNMINIHIHANRGELYTVREIEFTGNTLFSDEQVRREFTFDVGSAYSPEAIRETIGKISDLYGRRGYIDASVDFDPSLDIDTRAYSIHMIIEEGKQYRVGMIKVFGNTTTQTSIILHESLLIPGEIFNIERLKLTEQKLINVGYFETVNVYAVKSDGPLGLGECYRDVHIEVKETSTGHFGAFIGYSTQESFFGGLNITERNFNYRGLASAWRDGFSSLRGGGEYAHATVQIGLKSRKYIASWAKPFFMDTPWTVGFDIERNSNRYISDDYEINSTAFILHATYKINSFVHLGWHYRITNSDVHVEEHDDSSSEEEELEKDSRIGGLISATGVTLTYDSTDHPVTPRSGFKSRGELEYAGIGGDHRFVSAAYLNSYFYPIDKKSVFKFRADLRFIIPCGEEAGVGSIPINERLFLGGDAFVRGYRSYRIGPVYKTKNGKKSDDPRGGISEQYYSIEITRRLHSKVEAFAFCDGGYLSTRQLKMGYPYWSMGIGARLKLIESIPSLTFGYGIPLNAKNNSQEKRFFISVGGQF
ncbi:MAG: outer membrane protein assembly factor BamA [Parachlamydiaceae bacterium]